MNKIVRLVIEVETEYADEVGPIVRDLTELAEPVYRSHTVQATHTARERGADQLTGASLRWWIEEVSDRVELGHDEATLERIETVTRVEP